MTDEQLHQFTTWLDHNIRSTAEAITWVEQQAEFHKAVQNVLNNIAAYCEELSY